MSSKFIVEGGLSIPQGNQLELAGTALSAVSNDTSLADASQSDLVTEYAVKSYVDANNQFTISTGDTGDDFTIEVDDTLNFNSDNALTWTISEDNIALALDTGAGLEIDNAAGVQIAASGVTNAMLANSSLTVTAGSGLSGGGEVALGSSIEMALDLSESAVGEISNASDTFLFVDADDAATKQESIADLVSNMAGSGITATDGSLALTENAVSYGGVSLNLGGSDATPAFDLRDATSYPGDSALTTTGTISAGTWQGTAIATGYIADDAVTPAKIDIFDDSLAATDTHILIADGTDYSSFAVSGDVTMSNGGAVTIGANKVTNSMLSGGIANAKLANSTISGKELGTNLGGLTSTASGGISMTSYNGSADVSDVALDVNSMTDLGSAAVAGDDEFAMYDLNAAAMKKVNFSDLEDSVFGNVSGDITIAAGGAATIGSNAVEMSMLSGGVLPTDITIASANIVDETIVSGDIASGTIANDRLVNNTFEVVAGSGLKTGGSAQLGNSVTLDLDLAEATVGAINVANDSFLFVDADDSNNTKKETIADLVAEMDGTGLTALSGSLSVDATQAQITGIGTSGIATTFAGTVNVDEAVTLDTTLGVTGVATFTAESVHTNGIDCNGQLSMEENNIIGTSDDMLVQSGTVSDYDWSSGSGHMALQAQSELVLDSAVRRSSDFAVTANGSEQEMFSFNGSNFHSAKVHVRIGDGTDVTAKELLIVCDESGANPAFVEYGTVNSGNSEMANSWAVSASGGTISVKCTGDLDDTIKGSFELLKA